ncbi:MAG: mercuric reductase [Gemmatimonadota bacterium]|nr:mercuric reductase [Gemmatimonadota bacterium]
MEAQPPIVPLDEANRRLVAEVHPPDWVNPEPADRYDLVVIGAGTGGLVSAAIGAAVGARVALVERHLMGGDCLNTGCVPSKAVLRAARAWAGARAAADRFGGPPVAGEGDFGAVMARMRGLRADISEVDGAERFRSLGVDVFFGQARFTSARAVDVDGAALRFRRAILAAGGRPALPPIPGLAEAEPHTSDTIFGLTERPERLVVLGAGPIGCELAQAFARLGSRVTLVNRSDRVLSKEEPEAAEIVRRALERDGVVFRGGRRVLRVERGAEGTTLVCGTGGGEERIAGDALLVALGRTPNVEGLDLAAAGVEMGPEGVATDERLRTTNRAIYAVGDIASRLQFTHAADAQARLAIRNALFFGRGKKSRLVIPRATYTSPEVAAVGRTSGRADGDGAMESVTVPLADVDRARLDGEEEGFVRVHLAPGKDRILGATIVAEHAGELISQVTQALATGTGLSALGDMVYPYPTVAEALRKAADARRRDKLTPRARRMLEIFLAVTRRLP